MTLQKREVMSSEVQILKGKGVPFLLNKRKQFSAANPSVGLVGTFLHLCWQLLMVAMHRETVD